MATATPLEESADPVTRSVERAGVVVSLTLDRTRAQAGQIVRARGTVRNAGPGPLVWADFGCWNTQLLWIHGPELEQPPRGRDWPGTLGAVKERSGAARITHTSFFPLGALGGSLTFSCDGSDAGPAELAPGASWSFDMVWLGLLSHRLPAPAGEYRADFVFPFIVRGRLDAYEGNMAEDADPITVGVVFEVVGEPFAGVPPTTAVDRALAEPRVATWLAGMEVHEIELAGIVLLGDQWMFMVDSRGRGTLRVHLQASDGAIRGVEIDP